MAVHENMSDAPGAPNRYAAALCTTLRATAAAYGYTLTIATSMGLLTTTHGAPHSGRLFLFVIGGVAGFAVLEVVLLAVPGGGREVNESFPFAGVLNLVSTCGGLGAAVGLAHAVPGAAGWVAAPLGATIVYLALVALQVRLVVRRRK